MSNENSKYKLNNGKLQINKIFKIYGKSLTSQFSEKKYFYCYFLINKIKYIIINDSVNQKKIKLQVNTICEPKSNKIPKRSKTIGFIAKIQSFN